MRIPVRLSQAFGAEYDALLAGALSAREWIPEASALASSRFLSRSVAPHVKALSSLFNRAERESQGEGLEAYWGSGSNPANRRLAYVLGFMTPNLCRVAAVWAELARLGYRWPFEGPLAAIEWGAGPATGACGIAAGEWAAGVGLPKNGRWALMEQDGPMLEFGREWAESYFTELGIGEWSTRGFKGKIAWDQDWLPRSAPRFQLWVMSFFLNESPLSPSVLAARMLKNWDKHLEPGGLALFVEPALKMQSRRLLELRKELLAAIEKRGGGYRVLLPCLGHQACGALADPEDWCHEEITWWRSPLMREIDSMTGLDRKTLPFSYLVIERTADATAGIARVLPELTDAPARKWLRLVSPAHREGKWREFYTCGADGKHKTRWVPVQPDQEDLGRGDLLQVDAGATLTPSGALIRLENVHTVR